jgi:hypothetical protein
MPPGSWFTGSNKFSSIKSGFQSGQQNPSITRNPLAASSLRAGVQVGQQKGWGVLKSPMANYSKATGSLGAIRSGSNFSFWGQPAKKTGGTYGSPLSQKKSPYVVADEKLRNSPVFWTGFMRSLYLSQKNEPRLLVGYRNAGGQTTGFFADAKPGTKDHLMAREERQDTRDREQLLNYLAAVGLAAPVDGSVSNSELYAMGIVWASARIQSEAEKLIGDLNIDVDYTKLENLSRQELLALITIIDTSQSIETQEGVGNPERAKEVIDTLFVLNVLQETSNSFNSDSNERGLKDFKTLSDVAAQITNNDKGNYLYVMNTLLLHYSSSGSETDVIAYNARFTDPTSIVDSVLSKEQIDFLIQSGTYSANGNVIKIANQGLHNNYDPNDNGRGNQIGEHIWAYMATTAAGGMYMGDFAVTAHDILSPMKNLLPPQWQDAAAGRVAVAIGNLLYLNAITPDQVGDYANYLYSLPYEEFYSMVNLSY